MSGTANQLTCPMLELMQTQPLASGAAIIFALGSVIVVLSGRRQSEQPQRLPGPSQGKFRDLRKRSSSTRRQRQRELSDDSDMDEADDDTTYYVN